MNDKFKYPVIIVLFLSLIFQSNLTAFASMPELEENQGVYVQDTLTGKVLLSKNEDKQMAPASMTKLMTALVVMDYIGGQLDTAVTIGGEVTQIDPASSVAHVGVGDTYTWKQLLYGLLLPSGNDAAMTIAIKCAEMAKQQALNVDDAVTVFAELMNAKAESLGLTQTHFINPHGLSDPAHYTTPKEMAIIAKTALNNPTIFEVASTPVFHCVSGKGQEHDWMNTNILIQNDADILQKYYGDFLNNGTNLYYRKTALAGKTGYTPEAGRCLSLLGDNGEISAVAVIMNVDEQETVFKQAAAIMDELDQYTHIQWTAEAECVDWKLPVFSSLTDGFIIKANTYGDTYSTILKADQENMTSQIEWKEEYFSITGPFAKVIKAYDEGEIIAEIAVYAGENCIDRVPLYAASKMEPIGFVDVLLIILIILLLIFIILLLFRRHNIKKAKKRRAQKMRAEKATNPNRTRTTNQTKRR